MSKFKSRVIRGTLILLVIVLLSIVPQIKAEETTETLSCTDLQERYGLRIEQTSADSYKIIKDNNIACGKTTKEQNSTFTVIRINGTGVANGGIVKPNSPVTITAGQLVDGITHYVTVTLKNNDPNVTEEITIKYAVEKERVLVKNALSSNVNYYGICATYRASAGNVNTKKYNFFSQSLPYCWQTSVAVNYSAEELQKKVNNINSLWTIFENQNNTTTGDFQTFKTKAQLAGNTITDPKSQTLTLKCAYDRVKTGMDEPKTYTNKYGESISSTEYYLNTDYYYSSSSTEDDTVVRYTYNYAPGNTKIEEHTACKRTCEEAVKVEYGPPVASKAGLCFEYKVKVTSHVKCTSEVIAPTPDVYTNSCNPAPKCVSTEGELRKGGQAGPTEDFERCIQSCDGGKYTEKCSIKCYNETYGASSKLAINYDSVQKQRTNSNSTLSTTAYSLDECLEDNKEHYGCYVYNADKTASWYAYETEYNAKGKYGELDIRYMPLGRWYIEQPNFFKKNDRDNSSYQYWLDQPNPRTNKGYWYEADQWGFFRNNNTITYNGVCDDNCTWETADCGNETYLNPGSLKKDAVANQQEYEVAVTSCIASASCSTHTAEFSISVNYDTTTGETKKVNTITFPYESNPDKLKANEDNNIADSSRSTILDYAGCYKNKNAANNYMTEWGFPGTYIHNKTGEISFTRPDVTDGWYYDSKKFCIPLDADTVNAKWWEWYKLGENCYTTAEIEQELNGKTGTSNGYNITAKTKKFGYFGWNFDIKCFYGLRNEVCNIDEPGCCPPGTSTETNGVSNYTFRSVAIDNLFPNAVEEGVVDPDKRPIGFNWTSKALSLKNSGYEVNPTALINHIESNASTLYSDEATNLDYRFYLTPATLAKIKSYNNKHNYATWDGTVEEKNGINVYKSNLFRNVGTGTKVLTEVAGSVIKLGEPGINNENYIKFGG